MRGNNFDGLRLVGALLVLIGHGFVLTELGRAPRLAGVPIHTLGLYIFFAVSGYLIYGSWTRIQAPLPYLRNRILRIFPALWVVVLLTLFLIGPLLTASGIHAYFTSSETWVYLANSDDSAIRPAWSVHSEPPFRRRQWGLVDARLRIRVLSGCDGMRTNSSPKGIRWPWCLCDPGRRDEPRSDVGVIRVGDSDWSGLGLLRGRSALATRRICPSQIGLDPYRSLRGMG